MRLARVIASRRKKRPIHLAEGGSFGRADPVRCSFALLRETGEAAWRRAFARVAVDAA
jgi:hypothetical protein